MPGTIYDLYRIVNEKNRTLHKRQKLSCDLAPGPIAPFGNFSQRYNIVPRWSSLGRKMTLTLRKGQEADAPATGAICYHAFKAIADAHNFVPDFPSPEIA